MPKNKPGPAVQKLRNHLDKTGPVVQDWTPEERADHDELSTAAMREQTTPGG
jgi:hypothetical protein